MYKNKCTKLINVSIERRNFMNLLINTLSLGLLLTFGFSYLLKLYLLGKRNNLKANVLGNKNKSRKTQKVKEYFKYLHLFGYQYGFLKFYQYSLT